MPIRLHRLPPPVSPAAAGNDQKVLVDPGHLGPGQAAQEGGDGLAQLLEQALAGYRLILGDDHPDSLHALNNLASTLRHLGDLRTACELHEQVLVDRRRVLGDDHPDTLIAMNSLATVRNRLEEL